MHGLHPELVKLVGRMKYRTSYGQNILEHSKEVAWLAGMMAAELKLDVKLAKRGALLHDVGKVLTHESEGTHVELGVEVARKYGENAAVINCIQAHHDDVPHESTESVWSGRGCHQRLASWRQTRGVRELRQALTKLEEIATGFEGVEDHVIQASREVRGHRGARKIDDAAALVLSETIAKRIENELQYPGQIKVVVIRETARWASRDERTHHRGVAIGKAIRAEVAVDVARLKTKGVTPGLAVVLVGENPASKAYVGSKEKACVEAGMHSVKLELPVETSETELLAAIDRLNADPAVHGILVQLPLPKQINSSRVLNRVNPAKDVDGFHPVNVGKS